MRQRLQELYRALEDRGLDALLISSQANITYLTGYPSRDSYLIISKKKNAFFTDSRYTDEAKPALKGIALVKPTGSSSFKAMAEYCLKLKFKRIGFEERHIYYAEYSRIKNALKGPVRLIPSHSLVEEARQVKDAKEILRIEKAIRITKDTLKFAQTLIAPGKKEIEIAAELERYTRYRGSGGGAFDIIVACAGNSAFAHHITSQEQISRNDAVLIDIGVDYHGYKSDLTRVFFLGKINILRRRIYDIARRAQEKAIEKIRPGVKASEIDRAAREYISEKGFGRHFGHNLGHGVGLEVHEYPAISANSDARLEPGMVFTVEPGIYLPGKFGVRIEDMVLVTETGCKVLSR